MSETQHNLSTHECLIIWQALTDYVDSGTYAPVNVEIANQLREEMLANGNAKKEAAAKSGPDKHNHQWVYEEGYRPLGECVRCDQLRTEKQAAGETPHNHEKTPFGRAVVGCPRCIELAKGAARRAGFNGRRWR